MKRYMIVFLILFLGNGIRGMAFPAMGCADQFSSDLNPPIDWYALSSGLNGICNAIAIHENEVYAGGLFTLAGGVAVNNIARWDGSSWIKILESRIEVFDAFGKLLLEFNVAPDMKQYLWNITDKMPGLYIWKFYVDNKLLESDKILFVK